LGSFGSPTTSAARRLLPSEEHAGGEEPAGRLAIDLAPMPDCNHLDSSASIVDDVQHAVIADTNPVGILSLKLDGASWSRRRSQAGDSLDDPIMRRVREAAELALCRALEQDLIRHHPRVRRERTVRYSLKRRAGSLRRRSTIAASIRSSLKRRSASNFSITALRSALGKERTAVQKTSAVAEAAVIQGMLRVRLPSIKPRTPSVLISQTSP
jgi:hypothetical protein